MEYTETRITKLRDYLINIIDTLVNNEDYEINADFLGDTGDFSIDKIPTSSEVETWITGVEIHRDVYVLRSRQTYSQDLINNLNNIGFFEKFEEIIRYKNDNKILPNINGIQEIKCLNCGALSGVDGTDEAIFDIQIQITYIADENGGEISL